MAVADLRRFFFHKRRVDSLQLQGRLLSRWCVCVCVCVMRACVVLELFQSRESREPLWKKTKSNLLGGFFSSANTASSYSYGDPLLGGCLQRHIVGGVP